MTSVNKLILVAVLLALWWFMLDIWIAKRLGIGPLWGDQRFIFLRAAQHPLDPYQVQGFFNPPWAAALLYPFTRIPLGAAMLIQVIFSFVLLALIIHRLGGGMTEVILCLTSYFAFIQMFGINIDWLVYAGILLLSWTIPSVD